MRIALASPVDVLGFRSESNALLAHQVPPSSVDWQAAAEGGVRAPVRGLASRPPAATTALNSIIPRSFLRLTELVVLHRSEDRFDLMYRLLWRLVHEPHLVGATDPDIALAQRMGQAVRREVFRMKGALKLRPVGELDGVPLRFAWFEPRHHVTEEVAGAEARSQPGGAWLMATPDRCVLCDDGQLLCGPGVAAAPEDEGCLELARRMQGQALATG
jgi:DNA polymerase